MLKANEAWAIAKKHSKCAEQLAEIEVLIREEAERGMACTWWYHENMTGYELKILAEKLEEFGYTAIAGDGVIYISWRDAGKE